MIAAAIGAIFASKAAAAARVAHGADAARLPALAVRRVERPLGVRVADQRRAQRTTPLVLANGEPLGHGALQRRPSQIVYSGDGAAYLGGDAGMYSSLRWSRYTQFGSRATGADWHNNCDPDCVDGTFHAYRAAIHLFRPERVAGHRLFTRMVVRYLRAIPPYPAARRTITFRLHYSPPYNTLFWNLN